jgi:hypothetical protein
LKDLDEINVAAKSTRSIFLISLILPVMMGFISWALVNGANTRPDERNPVMTSVFVLIVLALTAVPISFLFKWDWRARYYGLSLFGIASVSCLGVYPLLCIVVFGHLPLVLRYSLLGAEIAVICFWCSRFIRIYDHIYRSPELFKKIYVEDQDVVYFLQQGDKKVVEHRLKFVQVPESKYFFICFIVALLLCAVGNRLSEILGVPFVHIFLAVSMAPIPVTFFGFATKMWLLFFVYPRKIKKNTGKSTYVDMVSNAIV